MLGVVAWVVGQAPRCMLWWVDQPWPDALVVTQLAFGIRLVAVAPAWTMRRNLGCATIGSLLAGDLFDGGREESRGLRDS